MGTDYRINFELYTDTRDYKLAKKIAKLVDNFQEQIQDLRKDYDDKDYFDRCVNGLEQAHSYCGDYSGYEKKLINGKWLCPNEWSAYGYLMFDGYSDAELEKLNSLKIYDLLEPENGGKDGILVECQNKTLELPRDCDYLKWQKQLSNYDDEGNEIGLDKKRVSEILNKIFAQMDKDFKTKPLTKEELKPQEIFTPIDTRTPEQVKRDQDEVDKAFAQLLGE